MRALMRELIELYTGLLQLQGYILPATGARAGDADRARDGRSLAA